MGVRGCKCNIVSFYLQWYIVGLFYDLFIICKKNKIMRGEIEWNKPIRKVFCNFIFLSMGGVNVNEMSSLKGSFFRFSFISSTSILFYA